MRKYDILRIKIHLRRHCIPCLSRCLSDRKYWDIVFLSLETNFVHDANDEITLRYLIGTRRAFGIDLFDKGCTDNIAGMAVNPNDNINRTTGVTANHDQLEIMLDLDKAEITSSNIWSHPKLEFCVRIRLLSRGNVIKEDPPLLFSKRNIEITFNFNVAFGFGTVATSNTHLVNVGNNGIPADAFPLRRCEGDCDSDEDCEGHLVCFTREGIEEVPGCAGNGVSGDDYCTDRPYDAYLTYRGNNGVPASAYPLRLCEGSCDNNSDCAEGLHCLRRPKFEAVPGCDGLGARGKDYCIPGNSTSSAGTASSSDHAPSSDFP